MGERTQPLLRLSTTALRPGVWAFRHRGDPLATSLYDQGQKVTVTPAHFLGESPQSPQAFSLLLVVLMPTDPLRSLRVTLRDGNGASIYGLQDEAHLWK